MKNHTQNVMKKLFSDPFLKNQNWAYRWINSQNFYTLLLLLYAKLRTFEIC